MTTPSQPETGAPPGRQAEGLEGRGLDERHRSILRGIIEDYIQLGEPVGSQSLAPRYEISSATVRNVMADLEAEGFLEKAHTSSGRRPTDAGYRYYVDTLLTVGEPGSRERRLIEKSVPGTGEVSGQLVAASQLLHELSRHTGLVAIPKPDPNRLRQIDLLRLSDGRILAVLVTLEGLIHNKLFRVDFEANAEELTRATATLNQLLQSQSVEEIREKLAREIREKRAAYDQLLEGALSLVELVLADVAPSDLLVSGQASLLSSPDLDLSRIRVLFSALEEKSRLLRILEQVANAGALQLYIGSESELGQGSGVALVASPYGVSGRVLGSVGVIGPTRMDYAKVIPLVEYTARTVSKILQER